MGWKSIRASWIHYLTGLPKMSRGAIARKREEAETHLYCMQTIKYMIIT
jgi:hypothetical protein